MSSIASVCCVTSKSFTVSTSHPSLSHFLPLVPWLHRWLWILFLTPCEQNTSSYFMFNWTNSAHKLAFKNVLHKDSHFNMTSLIHQTKFLHDALQTVWLRRIYWDLSHWIVGSLLRCQHDTEWLTSQSSVDSRNKRLFFFFSYATTQNWHILVSHNHE